MKFIIVSLIAIFALLGGGLAFYETQIASPSAGAIQQSQVSMAAVISEPVIPPLIENTPVVRVVDLAAIRKIQSESDQELDAVLKELEQSIQKTIQDSSQINIGSF